MRCGPDAGHYLVEPRSLGDPPRAIVRFVTLDAMPAPRAGGKVRRLLGADRARTIEPRERDDDARAPRTRARVTRAEALGDASEADEWIARMRSDEEEREHELELALGTLNRALADYRAASCDPYLWDVPRELPRRTVIGVATGNQTADGRWSKALLAPAVETKRSRREEWLDPQAEFARMLRGATRPLVCEDILLRARLDLTHGRSRAAAIGLEAGLAALRAELGPGGRADERSDAQIAEDLGWLAERAGALEDLGDACLAREIEASEKDLVGAALDRCERILRRRRYRRDRGEK